ncbi:type II toxin-antitoxin system PemK/MazF family toxin [Nitratifractor sp.]
MTVSRGEVWLANLNPIKKRNEVGKVRPVYILQTDELNSSAYPTTIVLPLTTVLIEDAEPLRFRIVGREALEKDSDVLIAQVRAIDNSRFVKRLCVLNRDEVKKIKQLFDEVIA